MRGNERTVRAFELFRFLFSIPMRGNEWQSVLKENQAAIDVFSIPMRGNETAQSPAGDQGRAQESFALQARCQGASRRR